MSKRLKKYDFESAGETASRFLANRFSRRSFIGSLGTGAVALAAGGVATVARPEEAEAAYGCTYDRSTDCYRYWGYNDCPPNTCGCGYWEVCDHTRCSLTKRWSDCCGHGCSCHCVDGHPSCCAPKTYPQGCSGDVGRIKCRRWYCVGGGVCG
jgi:hypothetical protein